MRLFNILVSHAQMAASSSSNCTINGNPVPCAQFIHGAAWFAGLGIGLLLIIVAVGILALIFWISMLVHAIRHQIHDKALWIIILLLFGILGAIIYYFAVKRHWSDVPPSAPAAPEAH